VIPSLKAVKVGSEEVVAQPEEPGPERARHSGPARSGDTDPERHGILNRRRRSASRCPQLIDVARVLLEESEALGHVYSEGLELSGLVAGAEPALSMDELAAFGERVRAARTERPRGALAIVADSNRGEFARFFTQLRTGTDAPPTQVFRSIHDARRWLSEQPLDL